MEAVEVKKDLYLPNSYVLLDAVFAEAMHAFFDVNGVLEDL